jgi:hypothetical protein
LAERPRSSLQRRLFGWLMLPLLVVLPVLGMALYQQVQSSAQSWLDEGLEDTALTLAGQIDLRSGEPRIDISATMDRALRFDRQDDVFYLVLAPRGETPAWPRCSPGRGRRRRAARITATCACVAACCAWCSWGVTAAAVPARCWWPRHCTSAMRCSARSPPTSR